MKDSLIYKYIMGMVNLYGIVDIDTVLETYNIQNDEKIQIHEIDDVVNELDFDTEFFGVIADIFVHESLFIEDDYVELIDMQGDKPYYIPSKEHIIKYAEDSYYEVTKEFKQLKKCLKDNFDLDDETHLAITEDIQLICKHAFSMDAVKFEFERMGVEFQSIEQLNEVIQCVFNLHNNTRIWENRGYTPLELRSNYTKSTRKVGRNEPCPCGSGKKYKKCCL